jgi:hypothetical protein
VREIDHSLALLGEQFVFDALRGKSSARILAEFIIMGTGSSHFLAEEAKLLQDFSSENAWAYDDERWLPMLHFKEGLNTVTPGVLVRDLQDTARRLCESGARGGVPSHAVWHLRRCFAYRAPAFFSPALPPFCSAQRSQQPQRRHADGSRRPAPASRLVLQLH